MNVVIYNDDLAERLSKVKVLYRCGICCHGKMCDKCLEATKKANGWTDADVERERDLQRRYSCSTPNI